MRPKTAVVALSGAALVSPRSRGSAEEYLDRLHETTAQVVEILRQGYRLVLTHSGSLPLRNMLLQSEAARSLVPALPLDALAAQTQGQIGYWLTLALENALSRAGLTYPVACLITRVLVDPKDPEFAEPSRPMGPIFTTSRAMELLRQGGRLAEVAPGQWRHLTPAPQPQAIMEAPAVACLLEKGHVVVAGGGGGIPVVRTPAGLRGVEAQVHKEAAAACLARALQADLFVQVTESAGAAPARLSLNSARTQLSALGSKRDARALAAAVQFVEAGRGRAIITNLGTLSDALRGEAGTQVGA